VKKLDELPAGSRVAIAEDEALIAEELKLRLTRMGLFVSGVAATGQAAMQLAESTRPSLMLMDIRLRGELDGIDAAMEIVQRWQIPIVFLTAHSDDATIERARRVGPYGFLIKPVGDRELRATVTMALHRAALEHRLRESEERFATTLASIGDGVIATDDQGRITFMNAVAEDITRWPRADGVDRDAAYVIRLVDAVTKLPMADPIRRALNEDGVVTLGEHAVLVRRDGSEIPVDDSAAPIRTASGEVRGAVMVFRDITEQQRARQQLRDAEARLLEAERLESIGRLAGGVAHDINNMMMVTLGYADLALEDRDLDPDLRSYIEQIKDSSGRAANVCRQLLAYSRRQILRTEAIDVNAVVSNMEPMLKRMLGEDIKFHLALDAGLRHCLADASQLERVILNLCLNARDAMPDGGQLSITTANAELDAALTPSIPELQPGKYVAIAVSDTGAGIDPSIQQRVFEPFFTTKAVGKGTGLGLATCYGIVRQSNGYITVYSEPGEGSTFKVYLPEAPNEPMAVPSGAGQLPTGRETVLVVEDEDGVREIVRLTLQGLGYEVLQAADGPEALRQAEQHGGAIDLLLTDAIMPVMTGRQLWENLRHARSTLRVVFMSGYTEDRILRQGIEHESMPFLLKPFGRSDLARKVREVLDHPR